MCVSRVPRLPRPRTAVEDTDPPEVPGQKAMQALRSRMRKQTERHGLQEPLTGIVAQRHPIIRGWRTSFRGGNATKKFQDLDHDGR